MGRDEGTLIGSLVGVGVGIGICGQWAVRAPLQECSGTDMPLLSLRGKGLSKPHVTAE